MMALLLLLVAPTALLAACPGELLCACDAATACDALLVCDAQTALCEARECDAVFATLPPDSENAGRYVIALPAAGRCADVTWASPGQNAISVLRRNASACAELAFDFVDGEASTVRALPSLAADAVAEPLANGEWRAPPAALEFAGGDFAVSANFRVHVRACAAAAADDTTAARTTSGGATPASQAGPATMPSSAARPGASLAAALALVAAARV